MSDTNTYEIRDGIIVSPGKFEGEPRYATAMWDSVCSGFADHDFYDPETDTCESIVLVTADDVALYPELKDVYAVHLYETEQGFVCTTEVTLDEVNKALADYEGYDVETGDSTDA